MATTVSYDQLCRELAQRGWHVYGIEHTGGGCDYLRVDIPDMGRFVWFGWGRSDDWNVVHLDGPGPQPGDTINGCVYRRPHPILDGPDADPNLGWCAVAALDDIEVCGFTDTCDPPLGCVERFLRQATVPDDQLDWQII